MWWVSLVAFINFAFANFLVLFLLRGKRDSANTLLTFIALYIFLYKVVYYTYFQIKGAGFSKFPVEFSAVTYFVFSISVLLRSKKVIQFAAFASILAGLFYNIPFIITPSSFYSYNLTFEVIFATINHTCLYVGGLIILMYTAKFDTRGSWRLFAGTGLLIGYTYTAKHTIMKNLNVETVIIEICEAKIIKRVAPLLYKKLWFFIIYYIAIIIVFLGLIFVFYLINHKAHKTKKILRKVGTKTLSTGRLQLREFCTADADAMFLWASDEEVTRYLPWDTHETIQDSANIIEEWIKEYKTGSFYNWAIIFEDKVIGSIGLIVEDYEKGILKLGYVIAKAYWGKGIVPEAAKRVMDFCFEEINAEEVIAEFHEENKKSGRVMQKIGMRPAGKVAWGVKNNKGEWRDIYRYTLVKD